MFSIEFWDPSAEGNANIEFMVLKAEALPSSRCRCVVLDALLTLVMNQLRLHAPLVLT